MCQPSTLQAVRRVRGQRSVVVDVLKAPSKSKCHHARVKVVTCRTVPVVTSIYRPDFLFESSFGPVPSASTNCYFTQSRKAGAVMTMDELIPSFRAQPTVERNSRLQT